MTGTVDIQELKRRAEWLKDYGVKTMICEPPSILALIEVVEAAGDLKAYLERRFTSVDIDGYSHWTDEEMHSATMALRTALEGVKK